MKGCDKVFIEDIKVLIAKRGINMSEVARRLGDSPQNLSQKIKRNAIKDIDLEQICKTMNCSVEVVYKDKDTGEVIYSSKL